MGIDYAAGGRPRKLRPDEAWATIEKLAQYEDEGWNDVVIPDEVSLNYENPDIEQLLGIMKRKVHTLMKDVISLMGRSESVFWMTNNEMYQPPPKPLRQEEFEHIVLNFILDQEERVKQLEEYMKVIIGDFMKLSLEFTRRELGALEVNPLPPKEYQLRKKFECSRYLRVVCTKCATMLFLGTALTPGTSLIEISSPTKVLLKPSLSPSTKTLSSARNGYDPNHLGVRFRLGGEQKEISLLKLGWIIGLYSEGQSRENATLSGLRKGVTVKANNLLLGFWPTIGDDGFNVGNTKVIAIRDPRVELAHRCIATTIAEVVEEDDEGDEAVGGDASHEGAGGSADMYRNMSQGDWQVRQARWMDQIPTFRLTRSQGMRPITHPLAIRDTCLQAMSTALAPLKMTLSRKSHLLEDKQIPNVGVFDEVFLALGWLLEEIHVTLAHLKKKRTRLLTYTESLKDLSIQWLEMALQA
ncbi:hypothetical protein Tco_0560927 [Tanacetum coccineum]